MCHAIWLRRLFQELQLKHNSPTNIYVENKLAIALAKNSVHHERSKHINTRFHFIREHIKIKEIEMIYVKTREQIADIFTKPLKSEVFKYLRDNLGMLNGTSLRGGNVE